MANPPPSSVKLRSLLKSEPRTAVLLVELLGPPPGLRPPPAADDVPAPSG